MQVITNPTVHETQIFQSFQIHFSWIPKMAIVTQYNRGEVREETDWL